jgi:hypothetical protein
MNIIIFKNYCDCNQQSTNASNLGRKDILLGLKLCLRGSRTDREKVNAVIIFDF